jgi:threonine dehydratase
LDAPISAKPMQLAWYWPRSSDKITRTYGWRGVTFDLHRAINVAGRRLRSVVRHTPLLPAPALGALGGDSVYLKAENLQITGSFKVRGAFNKLWSLTPTELARGVVAASSGNHGAAVAYALRQIGKRGVIFVPSHAATSKVAAIRQFGAEVRVHGDDSVEAEMAALAFARENGRPYISPYNDWAIITGQGAVGYEIVRDLPDVQTIYVTVGGGGLIGGIGGYFKGGGRDYQNKRVRIVGCLPANSPVMAESVRAGRIVEMAVFPTLSDGSAGGIEDDAVTLGLCAAVVDDWILVEEAEIAAAMRLVYQAHHMTVEGAAGVAVAAYLKDPTRGQQRNAVIVLCGGNIDQSVSEAVLREAQA